MRLIINADDFGLSSGINQNILKTFDRGCLTSTSLMANGHAFDEAVQAFKQRPDLRLSIHLNVVESKPVFEGHKTSHLLNENGVFAYDFISLLKKYYLSNSRVKAEIRQEIYDELDAQISKVKAAIDRPLALDSHQHTHILPFVWDELIKLSEKHEMSYIRIPREPFYLSLSSGDGMNYISSNPIKLALLNHLAKRCYKSLENKPIASCRYFVGVLFTGCMTQTSIEKALSKISQCIGENEYVEVLLHPGRAEPGEEEFWRHYPAWKNYYYSKNRGWEGELLLDEKLQKTLERYKVSS